MKFSTLRFNILFHTIVLFLVLLALSFAIVKAWYWLVFILIPLVIYQLFNYYQYHKKTRKEIEQFVESVHYRDFSRHFEVNAVPEELKPFRIGFNKINETFKAISKEKETQFLHLKNILEIVDTGILSYEIGTGDVLWMNESLKKMLQIPYLKTIHSLKKRNTELYEELQNLNSGQKTVISISAESTTFKILLAATKFENESKTYKLIAFQNIHDALDEGESKAWQKLLSVMTHEIMNSVAPITSLAETMEVRIAESLTEPASYTETLSDLETGIKTIKKRSEGLLRFTETYRNLSKINKVNRSKVYVLDLFGHVQQLMQPSIEQCNIVFEVMLKVPSLAILADAALIEQVLINLILNARDAVKDVPQARISMSAEAIDSKVVIKVSDNGQGIEPELLDKIFIPFFSTKKNGNGIGLSLCKQVMILHKGTIAVKSVSGHETQFSLFFDLMPNGFKL